MDLLAGYDSESDGEDSETMHVDAVPSMLAPQSQATAPVGAPPALPNPSAEGGEEQQPPARQVLQRVDIAAGQRVLLAAGASAGPPASVVHQCVASIHTASG